MGFDSFFIPNVQYVDSCQEYSFGDLVGVTAGVDKWAPSAGALGLYVGDSPNLNNGLSVRSLWGNSGLYRYKQQLNANQYVIAQNVIPLGHVLTGSFQMARMDEATGDGYYITNGSDTDVPMAIALYVRKGGATYYLASWMADTTYGGNVWPIDGVDTSDGIIIMLEACGFNPVQLRVSVMTDVHSGMNNLIDFSNLPANVPPGTTMPHAFQVVGTYDHYGPNMIASGAAGIFAYGRDGSGALLNFGCGDVTWYTAPVDTAAPTVTTFTVPATSSSLTVPITTLSATDNTAVTGYLVTESAAPPDAGASGWKATAAEWLALGYTFASAGSKTLYAWAKDAAGNVSASAMATVVIASLTQHMVVVSFGGVVVGGGSTINYTNLQVSSTLFKLKGPNGVIFPFRVKQQ